MEDSGQCLKCSKVSGTQGAEPIFQTRMQEVFSLEDAGGWEV